MKDIRLEEARVGPSEAQCTRPVCSRDLSHTAVGESKVITDHNHSHVVMSLYCLLMLISSYLSKVCLCVFFLQCDKLTGSVWMSPDAWCDGELISVFYRFVETWSLWTLKRWETGCNQGHREKSWFVLPSPSGVWAARSFCHFNKKVQTELHIVQREHKDYFKSASANLWQRIQMER